jgi:hypothetical protein
MLTSIVKVSVAVIFAFTLCVPITQAAIADRVAGKILINVEDEGRAWYVHPQTHKRFYLGDPANAFEVIRTQGIGITHEDLDRIPIAYVSNNDHPDHDRDGVDDRFEVAYYLNPNDPDTDGDGYLDGEELENGYNPFGPGKLFDDTSFSSKHAGKIFLDVENRGQAWYVNPVDNKRYFLGRAYDAYTIMSSLGLGISDADLKTIERDSLSDNPLVTVQLPKSPEAVREDNPAVCTLNFVYGLTVTAVNKVTKEKINDAEIHVWKIGGNPSLHETLANGRPGLGEAPRGEYQLVIEAQGFQPYLDRLYVPHDGCHVIPQNLTIPMTPHTLYR